MQNNQSVLIIHSGPKQEEARVPKWGGGKNTPIVILVCFDRFLDVLTEELLLRKLKKLLDFLLQNITKHYLAQDI